jgi:serine/threonine-protein kinase HipA
MKTLDDISSYLRNALSNSAYDYEVLDAELGLAAGTIVRILDAASDYSAMELMVVLERFGLELDIFEQKELQRMREGSRGPSPELAVKTKVQIAVDNVTQPKRSAN